MLNPGVERFFGNPWLDAKSSESNGKLISRRTLGAAYGAMKKILVECTDVYDHPEKHSGIQRVVRNVVQNLGTVASSDYECLPVVLKYGGVYQVRHMPSYSRFKKWHEEFRSKLLSVKKRYWLSFERLAGFAPFRSSLTMHRLLFLSFRVARFSYSIPLELTNFVDRILIEKRCTNLLPLEDGDVLLLLDASWFGDHFEQVKSLKQGGVKVISVIYDMIPLTHPQFCDEDLVKVFNGWLNWILESADGYIAISKTIAGEFDEYLKRRVSTSEYQNRWVRSFNLGADFNRLSKTGTVRDIVERVFDKDQSVYLTVSTIEPRKNHAYMLDAFDQLWQQGEDVVLCIVGKVGWKTESLVNRIRNHKDLNQRLYMLNDLTDDELEFCYENADALIFASYVEGFGLPLVEAAQRGLPVLCSDIPVFREVGGKNCEYFKLEDAASLVDCVVRFEEKKRVEGTELKPPEWISWAESAQQLISVTEAGLKR